MSTSRIAMVAATVLGLDQATKYIVIKRLPLHDSIPLAPFFSLTHIQNTGAAFGILPGGNLFFLIVTFLILGVLVAMHRSLVAQGYLSALGLSFLWGGAIGNLIDRIIRGRVIDFLDFYWRDWHWPAFNVADSGICVGTFLLIAGGFWTERKNPSPPPAAPAA